MQESRALDNEPTARTSSHAPQGLGQPTLGEVLV